LEQVNTFFCGKMASGKTTFANHLVAGYGYTRLALADPIKGIEQSLADGVPYAEITERYLPFLDFMERAMFFKILDAVQEIPREEPKPRKRLQYLGTDGARKKLGDDIWIRAAAETAKQHPLCVLDDVRFLNEYRFFMAQGWRGVALPVDAEVQDKRLLELYGQYDPKILEHESERQFDQILACATPKIPYILDTSRLTSEQGIQELERLLNQHDTSH
jgi:dephospho-CoA kinase